MIATDRLPRLGLAIAAFMLSASAALAFAPPGSYQNSCTNAYMDGNDLVATCRTIRGDEVESVLPNARNCRGDISNRNGQLSCNQNRGAWAPPPDPEDEPEEFEGPDGSYQQSCRAVEVNGNTLSAECRDGNGRFRYTELPNFNRCRGDISNRNGALFCPTSRQLPLPPGSWRNSCENATVNNGILFADCRNNRGNFRSTQIPLNACGNAGFQNVNGVLRCQGYVAPLPPAPIPVPVPPIRPQASITLYTDARFRGHSRTFLGDEPDLAVHNWANVASSLHVSGAWQLCSGPNYSGQCVTVSESSANLAGFFNDQARSLRRIR